MGSSRSAELADVCRSHGIALAYLFGSQAEAGVRFLRGEKVVVRDPLGDLDVGVVTGAPLPPPAKRITFYALLHNDLADLFEPFRLDLTLLEENHSVFQLEAVKGICVYQASEEKRDDYEMMILRRAADFAPFLDMYLRERLEEVQSMVNRRLVEERLEMISDHLAKLELLAKTPEAGLFADWVKPTLAESCLRRSLEAIFDVGRHVLAKTTSVDMAAEYRSIARGLAGAGVVDAALGRKLGEMAGYRNRLVQLYNQVTPGELYEVLTGNLDDIRSFVRQIRTFLADQPGA